MSRMGLKPCDASIPYTQNSTMQCVIYIITKIYLASSLDSCLWPCRVWSTSRMHRTVLARNWCFHKWNNRLVGHWHWNWHWHWHWHATTTKHALALKEHGTVLATAFHFTSRLVFAIPYKPNGFQTQDTVAQQLVLYIQTPLCSYPVSKLRIFVVRTLPEPVCCRVGLCIVGAIETWIPMALISASTMQIQWIPNARYDCSTSVALNAYFFVGTPSLLVEFRASLEPPVCCRVGLCILLLNEWLEMESRSKLH